MYQGDLVNFLGKIIRVSRIAGNDYVGPLTMVDLHEETALPGADRLHFYQPNTGRIVTIYRADIADISVICEA